MSGNEALLNKGVRDGVNLTIFLTKFGKEVAHHGATLLIKLKKTVLYRHWFNHLNSSMNIMKYQMKSKLIKKEMTKMEEKETIA